MSVREKVMQNREQINVNRTSQSTHKDENPALTVASLWLTDYNLIVGCEDVVVIRLQEPWALRIKRH